MRIFFILFFCTVILKTKGQIIISDPFQNPIILSHYSIQDLQMIQQTDSVKFNTIKYYYTKSFIFEEVTCTDCIPVTALTFDVGQYEYLRQSSRRFVRHFEKYGFKLTLLSIDELLYKLPIHFAK